MHGRLLTRLRSGGVWLLALCAAAGAALVLARELKFGVALHSDSVLYISVARNLLAGEGLCRFPFLGSGAFGFLAAFRQFLQVSPTAF